MCLLQSLMNWNPAVTDLEETQNHPGTIPRFLIIVKYQINLKRLYFNIVLCFYYYYCILAGFLHIHLCNESECKTHVIWTILWITYFKYWFILTFCDVLYNIGVKTGWCCVIACWNTAVLLLTCFFVLIHWLKDISCLLNCRENQGPRLACVV